GPRHAARSGGGRLQAQEVDQVEGALGDPPALGSAHDRVDVGAVGEVDGAGRIDDVGGAEVRGHRAGVAVQLDADVADQVLGGDVAVAREDAVDGDGPGVGTHSAEPRRAVGVFAGEVGGDHRVA